MQVSRMAAFLLLCPFSIAASLALAAPADEVSTDTTDPALEALNQYQQLKIESLKRDLAIARVDVEENCKTSKKKPAPASASKEACNAARDAENAVLEKIKNVSEELQRDRIAYEKKLAEAKNPPPTATPSPIPTPGPLVPPTPAADAKGRNPTSMSVPMPEATPMAPPEPLKTEVVGDPYGQDENE